MKKYLLGLFVFATAISFVGCDSTEEDPDANCVKKWLFKQYDSQAVVEINHETEKLSMQVYEGTEVVSAELIQQGFSGNFEVYAIFDNFQPVPNGNGYASMTMYGPYVPDTVLDSTIVACVLRKNQIQAVTGTTDTVTKNVVGQSGYFRIKKTGTTVLSQVVIGTDTVTSSKSYLATPDRISLLIGTNDVVMPGVFGIKFSSFTAVGGVNLQSDDFKCNSWVLVE